MNRQLVKYGLALGISGVISACSFSVYLDKLGFGKKAMKTVEDLPEEEIEPDFEFDED